MYVCRILHPPQSYITSDSAPSHMCLLIGKRGPRYLQGRCDLGGAELGTTTIAEHVETTCYSFRYYNYREAWSQWRVSEVIEE
jgi:hypothetical protein